MSDDFTFRGGPVEILGWLKREGFPFEMRVAKCFRDAGFDVSQSSFYTDRKEDKSREIDVSASKVIELSDSIYLRFQYIVECKSSLQRPWVMLADTSWKTAEGLNVSCRNSGGFMRSLLEDLSKFSQIRDLHPFMFPEAVAYSVRTYVGNKNQGKENTAFDAIRTIMSARHSCHSEAMIYPGLRKCSYDIIIPIVVTDAKLFMCSNSQDNEPQVTEIDRAVYLHRTQSPFEICEAVDVFTDKSLKDYLVKAIAGIDVFPKRLAEVCDVDDKLKVWCKRNHTTLDMHFLTFKDSAAQSSTDHRLGSNS